PVSLTTSAPSELGGKSCKRRRWIWQVMPETTPGQPGGWTPSGCSEASSGDLDVCFATDRLVSARRLFATGDRNGQECTEDLHRAGKYRKVQGLAAGTGCRAAGK